MIQLEGEQYLTVDEAAELLGVKPATLYAYVSRGLLRSYRRGIRRQRLYRQSEIEALTRLEPSRNRRRPHRPLATEAIPPAESWIRD